MRSGRPASSPADIRCAAHGDARHGSLPRPSPCTHARPGGPSPAPPSRARCRGAALIAVPAANAATDSTWDRVAQCESGGNWDVNTGNGFQGGLQFTSSTWRGFGGAQFAPAAHQASRVQQITVAERVLAKQGWGAWPVCSRKAGAAGESATQRSAPAQQVRLSAPATGGSSW